MGVLLCGSCVERQGRAPIDGSSLSTQIVIDGFFEDWDSVDAWENEPRADSDTAFNLKSIRASHDGASVHVMVSLDRELNFQGLDGSLNVLIDVDGNVATGVRRRNMDGVDLVVQFTPPNAQDPTERGMGVGVFLTADPTNAGLETSTLTHANLAMKMAPTYASQHVEFSLGRNLLIPGTPPLFEGSMCALKVVLISRDQRVTDESDVLIHALTPANRDGIERYLSEGVPSKRDDAVRVMSWNVEFGTILKKTAVYERILNSIDPDILLLQELTPADTADALLTFLNDRELSSSDKWKVILGGNDDDPIRCGIASRLPLKRIAEISFIPYPDRPDRFVRALAGEVSLADGRSLLATSVHLKCCGRIESREDGTRLQEVGLINQALRFYMTTNEFDGVVMGGDLNLVGRYKPVESLADGLDFDGSDLAIVRPYQLNKRSNATWKNPRSRFAPGRLDYLLLSQSSMFEIESFVFNSANLSRAGLTADHLKFDDSAEASDHYPIVVDFTWKNQGL